MPKDRQRRTSFNSRAFFAALSSGRYFSSSLNSVAAMFLSTALVKRFSAGGTYAPPFIYLLQVAGGIYAAEAAASFPVLAAHPSAGSFPGESTGCHIPIVALLTLAHLMGHTSQDA